MTKAGSRSPVRGQMLPQLGIAATFLAVTLLSGGVRLLPTAHFPGPPMERAAAAAGSVVYVPAGAHATGANGSNWRTDVELLNPGGSTASFTIQLLRRDTNNSSPASKAYTLGARQARRFSDILMSEFAIDGAAALRVVVNSGSVVVTSRTYNLVGQNPWNLPQGASFGQFVPGLDETEAIGYGQEGRLIHLTQRASGDLDGFRTNLGIVNASSIPIDVRIDFYRADGSWLGKRDGGETNLPPYGFRQLDQAFGAWGTLADGYAIVKPLTAGGALFSFATVIDNHVSGDPIFIPAVRRTASSASPTPTPTPTPTVPPSGRADLVPYKPSSWENPLVPDFQPGSLSTTFLSAHMNTYVRWAVANLGTANITARINFELRIDGTRYHGWYAEGLPVNKYTYVEDFAIPFDTLVPGIHTLTIVADYDSAIAESNESNNSWGKSWEWTSVLFRPSETGDATGIPAPSKSPDDIRLPAPRPVEAAATGLASLASAAGTVYVPAGAHATGVNGANWRTDVEVHNPNSTAVTFQIAFLRQATDNGGSTPTRSFSLGPQQSVRYADILSTVFQTDGAAALRFLPDGGATILVNSRTYNLIGANAIGLPVGSSFSQFVPGLDESSSAIAYGEEGLIIQLTHRDPSSLADFRTNIGYVNTTSSPIDLRIDLYSATGTLLGTIQDSRTHLRAYEFLQMNAVFGAFTSNLSDGYAVIRTTTPGGRFFAFATVIDNHLTGDPVFVPAQKVPSTWVTVGSGSIGSAGGTVSGGGLTVTVPSGTFSQSTPLTIRRSATASTPLEKFRTSEVFQLEGLPDVRSKAMTVTLDLTRSVAVAGADFVAAASEVFIPTAAALESPPMLLEATRSGSRVTATIPAATTQALGTADRPGTLAPEADVQQTFTIWAITGYAELVSAQGHFRVNYPVTDLVLGGAEEVAKGLESAYTKIAALDFDWTRRSSWPVYVSMEPFPADTATRLAETVPSRWGINSYWIHVNTDRLNAQADIPLMQEAAAHELFHLAQFLYDPRNRITMARNPGAWLWADEATSVWFENVFNGKSTPPQVVKENHAFMTRHGLEFPPGDPAIVQDHGYGAALLMRDLARRKGDAAVGEFIRRKSNSQVLPVDAYDLQTGASAESTWRLFLDEYARAHLYSGFPTPADLWVTSSGNRYTFATSTDGGKTFDWTAPDMSARFYGIQFTDKSWAAGTNVTVELKDPNKDAVSLVYKLKGTTLTSLGYHYDGGSFTVPNAETFAKDGTSLLIVVANGRAVSPYAATTPISLSVSAGGRNELDFKVRGTVCAGYTQLSAYFTSPLAGYNLTWSGNTVHVSWSGSVSPDNQSEYAGTVTLSSDRRTVVSLDFTAHWVTTMPPGTTCNSSGCRMEGWESITWTGVPAAADWGSGQYHFSVAGAAARARVSAFFARSKWTGFTLASQNHDCTYTPDPANVSEDRFDLWLTPPP